MIPNPTAERHRDYFEREMVVGRRVVFLWHVSKRWPDRPLLGRDEWIDGFEFATEDQARRFDLENGSVEVPEGVPFRTWEEAEAWCRESP